MSIRTELYDQLNNNVTRTMDSMQSIASTYKKAKTAYDNSYWIQIQQNKDSLMQEYQNEIKYCNTPQKMQEIQQQYQSRINEYVSEINAPDSVKNKWSNQYSKSLDLEMKKIREEREIPMMMQQAVGLWQDNKSGLIVVIGSDGNTSLHEKEKKLRESWDMLGLANMPKSVVGEVTTVEQALKMMESSCVSQYIDREYASNGGRTDSNFKAEELAKKAVDQIEQDAGKTFDVTTRASYEDVALKQISAYEKKAQDSVNEQQAQISNDILSLIAQGQRVDPEDILQMATDKGAFNPDGSVSKYWTGWAVNNIMATLKAKNDAKAVSDLTGKTAEEVQEVTRSYNPDYDNRFIEEDPENPLSEESTTIETSPKTISTDSVFADVFTKNGINYGNGVGKKTYTFSDGDTISTQYAPRVAAAAASLGISADSKEAMVQLVNLIEDEGASGLYDNPISTALVEQILIKKNDPNTPLAEYQNYLMGLINQGVISEQDLKDLNLWNPETKQFKSSPNFDAIKKDVDLRLSGMLESGDLKDVAKRKKKYSELNSEQKRIYETRKNQVLNALEVMFAKNPSAFNDISSTEYDELVTKVIKGVDAQELDKQISKALGWLGDQNIVIRTLFTTGSQNVSAQTVASMMFDSQNDGYDLVHSVMDFDVQNKINSKYMNDELNMSMKNAKDTFSQECYGKPYKDLSYAQKSNIDLGIFRNEYSKDMKHSIMEAYNLENNNLRQFYIDGVGPAYFDVTTGKFYASDRNPETTHTYITGKLTSQQKVSISTGYGSFILSELSYTTEFKKK